MTEERALQAIQRVFRQIRDDETIVLTGAMTMADVEGWDSVAQVKVVLTLEEELDIRLETEEVATIRSVADLVSAICKPRVK